VWRAPTEADLSLSLSELELQAYAEAASSAVGEETTAGMLARGADFVRGYLRGNPAIRLGPAGTIPEALVAPLMDYLAVDAIKRLPVGVSDERKEARRQALQTFRDVAAGKFIVPDDGAEDNTSTGGNASLASSTPNRFTPEKLQGL